MIDDDVLRVFKAALTHLMTTKMKATSFVFESISTEKGIGKIHGFLVADDVVAGTIGDLLDQLSKDTGGRQRFEIELDDKEGS